MAVILAIDLGNYKSTACRYEEGEFAFRTFVTSREALDRLLAEWPADLVANTAAEAWKFKHTKRKTDKDDALRLAQLTALGQLPTVTTPPAAVRQKRSLIAYRQTLVGRRVAMQNRLRALLVVQGLAAPRGAAAWSAAGLAAFDALANRWKLAAPTNCGAGGCTCCSPTIVKSSNGSRWSKRSWTRWPKRTRTCRWSSRSPG